MNVSHILLTWVSKVLGFNDCSINVLAPSFSHLFFIVDSQILADELGVDGNDFYHFVPKLEDLGAD